jgi:hypothetical protein
VLGRTSSIFFCYLSFFIQKFFSILWRRNNKWAHCKDKQVNLGWHFLLRMWLEWSRTFLENLHEMLQLFAEIFMSRVFVSISFGISSMCQMEHFYGVTIGWIRNFFVIFREKSRFASFFLTKNWVKFFLPRADAFKLKWICSA